MSSCVNRGGRRARRAGFSSAQCGCRTLGAALVAGALVGSLLRPAHAQQPRTAKDGVYSDEQAGRGGAVYKERCSSCHGATLGGDLAPPLTRSEFTGVWGGPLSGLVHKIQNTMPANDPGKRTRQQS